MALRASKSEHFDVKAEAKQENVAHQLLLLIYQNHPATIFVNVAATLGLAFKYNAPGQRWHWVWLAVVVCVSVCRLLLQWAFVHRVNDAMEPSAKQRLKWQRPIEAGLLISGFIWALVAWLVLDGLPGEDRFVFLIVLSALAGGATGVLAPLRSMGRFYIGLLLIPACIKLLVMSHPESVLAVLGMIFFVVMLVGHKNNHSILVRSLLLQEENSLLVSRLTEHNREIEALNEGLEKRVAQRTSELQWMANRDALTGLLNRRGLQRWLDQRFHQTTDEPYVILFLDLDRFKQINDGLGHDIGDKVLNAIANRFQNEVPEHGAIARWGGDEFVVVIPCDDSAQAQSLMYANCLRGCIDESLDVEQESLQVGVSIGIALSPQDGAVPSHLIRAADLAATEVKRTGRGQIAFYKKILSTVQERRLDINIALRSAVKEDTLSLVYQPIIDTASGKLLALEALLRWSSARLGFVGPDEFIPIAEDSDRIIELGNWVLSRACTDACQWGVDGPSVAVNVSIRQLLADNFVETVMAVLKSTGLPASRLDIEITESMFIENTSTQVLDTLIQLKEMGASIHVDDFGTGYSSLSRLQDFPLDVLKIDRSFVSMLDDQGAAIVEGALMIARRFGLRVVAEGVETQVQAESLHRLGVDSLQGYYLGRPDAQPQLHNIDPIWVKKI